MSLALTAETVEQIEQLARSEGVAPESVVARAIDAYAEAAETRAFFRAKAAGADVTRALALLDRIGEPPRPGDELTPDLARRLAG